MKLQLLSIELLVVMLEMNKKTWILILELYGRLHYGEVDYQKSIVSFLMVQKPKDHLSRHQVECNNKRVEINALHNPDKVKQLCLQYHCRHKWLTQKMKFKISFMMNNKQKNSLKFDHLSHIYKQDQN